MEYKNPYYRDVIQNLRRTIEAYKLIVSLFIAIAFGLILIILFQPVSYSFTLNILVLGGLFFITGLCAILFLWLKFIPNEELVVIEKLHLTLVYPTPKKNIKIPLLEIRHVVFNKLSHTNEATIESKGKDQDLLKMGIDFESHFVNSLSEENWKQVASEYGLELIITYDLDTGEDKDIYIIQKEDIENSKITRSDFQQLLSLQTNIGLLGIQEYINLSINKDLEPMEQYSIETQYGKESLDFVQEKIAVTYTKGKSPKEIKELTKLMEWTFKKL
jgi:hypothetical protein